MNSFEIANTEELKAVEGGNSVIPVPRLYELSLKVVTAVAAPLKMIEQYRK